MSFHVLQVATLGILLLGLLVDASSPGIISSWVCPTISMPLLYDVIANSQLIFLGLTHRSVHHFLHYKLLIRIFPTQYVINLICCIEFGTKSRRHTLRKHWNFAQRIYKKLMLQFILMDSRGSGSQSWWRNIRSTLLLEGLHYFFSPTFCSLKLGLRTERCRLNISALPEACMRVIAPITWLYRLRSVTKTTSFGIKTENHFKLLLWTNFSKFNFFYIIKY